MTTKKKRSARKAPVRQPDRDTMRAEYDFSKGVRGKYASRYPHGAIVVTIDPDLVAAYPSAAAVNAALRKLVEAPPARAKRRRSA
jgi:hypothetical protein